MDSCIEFLAVGVLEGDLAFVVGGEGVAREAAGAGAVCGVGGFAERVEGLASAGALIVEVASVATGAYFI